MDAPAQPHYVFLLCVGRTFPLLSLLNRGEKHVFFTWHELRARNTQELLPENRKEKGLLGNIGVKIIILK